MEKLIVFVCTSNTCRSPMAEAFARRWMEERGLSGVYRVVSRSMSEDYEPVGSPASDFGVKVLKEDYGLDTSQHRSQLISHDDAESACVLIGVTRSHTQYLGKLFPAFKSKIVSLSRDVNDPWHQPIQSYKHCAATMKPLVEEILQKITDSSS
jgi:protein-tyrosine-phosphatase